MAFGDRRFCQRLLTRWMKNFVNCKYIQKLIQVHILLITLILTQSKARNSEKTFKRLSLCIHVHNVHLLGISHFDDWYNDTVNLNLPCTISLYRYILFSFPFSPPLYQVWRAVNRWNNCTPKNSFKIQYRVVISTVYPIRRVIRTTLV